MNNFIIHKSKEEWGLYYYIMEINGHAYARGYTFNDDKKTFYLDSLSVRPKYRRDGLGLDLQELREKMAKKKGYKYTCLWVRKKTWMVKWYKRRGYKYYRKHKNKNSVWLRKKL